MPSSTSVTGGGGGGQSGDTDSERDILVGISSNNINNNNISNNNNNDETSSISSDKYERDVTVLNHCFDDIEKFIARLQHAAAALRELERRRRNRKSKKKDLGEGLLSLRTRPPHEKEFLDIFAKFKLSFNLLAKLKSHIHDPNAPELVHFLFTPLALIVEAANDTYYEGQLAGHVINPLLTREAINLLINCVTSKETELWRSLGDAWTVPRDQWKDGGSGGGSYHPVFMDGWSPDYLVIDELDNALPIATSSSSPTFLATPATTTTATSPNVGNFKKRLNNTDHHNHNQQYHQQQQQQQQYFNYYQQQEEHDNLNGQTLANDFNSLDNFVIYGGAPTTTTTATTTTTPHGIGNYGALTAPYDYSTRSKISIDSIEHEHESAATTPTTTTTIMQTISKKKIGNVGVIGDINTITAGMQNLHHHHNPQQDFNNVGGQHDSNQHQQIAIWLEDLQNANAKIVLVTYPRTANNDKELSVVRGEYLEVLDDTRKWWKARNMHGQVAHVPHTIVTPYNYDDSVDGPIASAHYKQIKDDSNNSQIGRNSGDNNNQWNRNKHLGKKGEFRYF